jgi:hypothetical protein
MSNSIVSSQESHANTIETETSEILKLSLSAAHSDSESPKSIEYTYHRHSAPKNTIYFRCSDKRCPARVHYNLDSRTYSLKNTHLNSRIHKRPSTQKTITINELMESPNSITRGSLVLSKNNPETEMKKSEEPILPAIRSRSEAVDEQAAEKMFMLQFRIESSVKFSKFSRKVIEKTLATKVNVYSGGKRFCNNMREKIAENMIEVYTTTHFMVKVLLLINDYFGRGVEVEFYQIE